MYRRSDYLSGVCSHIEYYDQFVTEPLIAYVDSVLGDEIRSSSDPESFDDIPLRSWDRLVTSIRPIVGTRAMKIRGDSWSIAGSVCVAKAAARKIYEFEKTETA